MSSSCDSETVPNLIFLFFTFASNALSATFSPCGWDGVVLSYSPRGCLTCLWSVAKSQTDLNDQRASATMHWLLGNGLESSNAGEKPTTEQQKEHFSLRRALLEISSVDLNTWWQAKHNWNYALNEGLKMLIRIFYSIALRWHTSFRIRIVYSVFIKSHLAIAPGER